MSTSTSRPAPPGQSPGTVVRTEDRLIDVVRSGAWRDHRAAELRAAFRQRFCTYDDGYAARWCVACFWARSSRRLSPLTSAVRHQASCRS
uniref:CDP-glycerol glycerophosphotransferase family protein n=1 Tax=Spiractinospora alimapuensis TaxID=2820884 RepID=UPI0037429B6A